jgi:aryl-alcohol dehydrogenase-like predicted oxidoreductase
MRLQVHHGGGELIELLERLVELVKAGKIDALAVCSVEGSETWLRTAYRQDMAGPPWALLVASVSAGQHALLAEGI